MSDLKIDIQQLRDSAKALKLISSEFTDANDNSDTLADAVGHSDLADHIRTFAHNWDYRRSEIVKVVGDLEKKMAETADGFEKVDKNLADKVKPQTGGQPTPTPTNANGRGPQ
jgi:hypothetical protein